MRVRTLALATILVPGLAPAGSLTEAAPMEEEGAVDVHLEASDRAHDLEEPDEAEGGEVDAPETDQPENEEGARLHVGGALRFNYFVKSWEGEEANRNRLGDFAFDTFRINADVSYQDLDLSLEYRFYAGYNMLHHGYFGYTFSGGQEMQVGMSRKPFGLLPYASHNWFFDITYYLGMEDNYDLGVKVLLPMDEIDLQLAFYKNSGGSFTGDSIDSARYSYDVVRTDQSELGYAGVLGPRTNEEVNQLNARLARTWSHGETSRTEVGLSGEYGGLYNATTQRTGDRWAAAVHVNGTYGRFNLMLQAATYSFAPELPASEDDRFIVMGAYDAPYKVAARGDVFVANLAYVLPVSGRLVDSLTFYDNFSYLRKHEESFADSQQNVVGVLVASGKLFTYVDAAFGRNHPWLGPDYGRGLAEGDPQARWELRFNINIGYYF